MKKKLICIMIFIIILEIFIGINYSEATSRIVKLSVSSATGNAGNEVSIDINLDNVANLASANLVLNYDIEFLECVSYTKGDVLNAGGMSIVKNNSDTGKIAIGYIGNPTNEDIIVQKGNILKVIFKLKSNFKNESNLTLESISLKNGEGIDLDADITNGKIVIDTKLPNDEDEENKEDKEDIEDKEDKEDIDSNQNSDNNNNINDNKSDNEGKDDSIDDEKKPTKLPESGLSSESTFILTSIILAIISMILYKKNKYMKDII